MLRDPNVFSRQQVSKETAGFIIRFINHILTTPVLTPDDDDLLMNMRSAVDQSDGGRSYCETEDG